MSERDIDAYQEWTNTTVVFSDPTKITEGEDLGDIMYCALGLAGEAGEVADKVKKLYRDGYSPQQRGAILVELGDVMWYASQLAYLFNVRMSEILQANQDKLNSRRARNKLHGSGDER